MDDTINDSSWKIALDARLNVPIKCPALNDLKDYVTFENPDYDEIIKKKVENLGETYTVPKFLTFVREDIVDGVVKFPIGVKEHLFIKHCETCPNKCEIIDNRKLGGGTIKDVKLKDGVNLRSGQVKAIQAAKQHFRSTGNGLIVMPTGTGKTLLGCELSRVTQLQTLFIVPRIDLAHQTIFNYKKYYNQEAGLIGDGTYKILPFTVAIIDTLIRKKLYEEWSEYFGLVIWDEVHGITTPKRYEVFVNLNTKYRLGISATLHKKNGLGSAINKFFGGVFYQLSIDDAIAQGDIVPLVLQTTDTAFVSEMQGRPVRHPRTYFNMVLDEAEIDYRRNKVISGEIVRCVLEGSKVVVVLNSRKQAEIIEQQLKYFPEVKSLIYMGHLKADERKEAKLKIETGELNVLLTVKLAGIGLDIPELDTIVMDQKLSDPLAIEQYIGRVVRACPTIGKTMARVVHIRDPLVEMFEKQFYKAYEVYKKFIRFG